MNILSLIVITPFISALILALIYLSDTQKNRFYLYTFFGVGTAVLITVFSLSLAFQSYQFGNEHIFHSSLFNWINLGDFDISLAFMADRLSVVMITFITFIGMLIHIYAVGYMRDDAGFGKFFSYFNLFMGSMLLLVLADNPIIMFVGWELVGLSSYLLIGYYHKDRANIKAANKAFILNRVGDFGFIMGLSLLFISLEGNAFTFISIKEHIHGVEISTLALIGGLLFVGAMGKSAQIPLYVWLPDAMAGPTPVSALIHAATMVTAGVYMVARFSFLYDQIPDIGLFIAYVGAFSALFAAIIASYQSDIKKILAYSTMSQLGYMFIAVGIGAYESGIFHVFTHAFFKALLFMGAGAVIVALHHEQNIFKMGGLKSELKIVYFTMLIATLSISGIPPFSGFFSKDAILVGAFAQEHYLLYGVGVITAFLSAFYMFRLFFSVFHAKANKVHHLQNLSKSMTYPLIILAFGSATVGFLGATGAYGGSDLFSSFISLNGTTHEMSHMKEYFLALINVAVAGGGIFLAYRLFGTQASSPQESHIFSRLIINKFYIDEMYEAIFIKPLLFMSTFIENIIDNKIFDALLNGTVFYYRKSGYLFAQLQNGKVRYYALYILAGVAVMSLSVLNIIIE